MVAKDAPALPDAQLGRGAVLRGQPAGFGGREEAERVQGRTRTGSAGRQLESVAGSTGIALASEAAPACASVTPSGDPGWRGATTAVISRRFTPTPGIRPDSHLPRHSRRFSATSAKSKEQFLARRRAERRQSDNLAHDGPDKPLNSKPLRPTIGFSDFGRHQGRRPVPRHRRKRLHHRRGPGRAFDLRRRCRHRELRHRAELPRAGAAAADERREARRRSSTTSPTRTSRRPGTTRSRSRSNSPRAPGTARTNSPASA